MTKRKYGIDLLRIVSMLFILILHILRQGGILGTVETGSGQYYAVWLMEAICICAVNCYGLISGYVNIDCKIKYYKIGVLWLQVVFYCLLITLIFYLIGNYEVQYYHWSNAIFLVCTVQYWYFTAYFALFFFMPYLNTMINGLSRFQMKALLTIIFILFSVAPTIWQADIFLSKNGYSFLWLALLYIAGALIKKLELTEKLSKYQWAIVFVAATAVAYIYTIEVKINKPPVKEALLIQYISPTIVAQALSLLALAVKADFKSKTAIRLVKFFSPLSFSVYLIHTNKWIWYRVLPDLFTDFAKMNTLCLVLTVSGIAIAAFLACTLIDYLRTQLFKAIKIAPALSNTEQRLREKLNPQLPD